ncbi:MAG: hypothetical protein PVSMB6_12600 [Steroidobacteraceae bacterium]
MLRAQFGLAPAPMAQWWTRLQEVPAEERGTMADALAGDTRGGAAAPRTDRAPRRRGGRRRGRRSGKPAAS